MRQFGRSGFAVGAGIASLLLASFLLDRFQVEPLPTPKELREAEKQAEKRAHEERLRDIPPLINLPAINPMTMQEALVLEPIGGLVPRQPEQADVLHPPKGYVPRMSFHIEYSPNSALGYGNSEEVVVVMVDQYPTEAWPLYFTKWSWNPELLRETNRDLFLSRGRRFGNEIVIDREFRDPDESGKLFFFWPSGKAFVTVFYSSKNINEEVLRRYLEKYKSSL